MYFSWLHLIFEGHIICVLFGFASHVAEVLVGLLCSLCSVYVCEYLRRGRVGHLGRDPGAGLQQHRRSQHMECLAIGLL